MMFITKNKKGIEAGGFSLIIGAVIVVASAVVILLVTKDAASRADEKVQVDLCRVSNEIKLSVDKRTGAASDILLGTTAPRACSTIHKTEEKLKVPTKKYPQDKEGAEAEIRDMIKNCWYMWLEGSEPNMFEQLTGSVCFTCYVFEIKDKKEVKDITFESIAASMRESFFVKDASDKCAPQGGFKEASANNCGTSNTYNLGDINGWKEVRSKKLVSGEKCCIRKEVLNECENKGGKCYEPKLDQATPQSPFVDYTSIYYKWSCPKRNQRCFVKEENEYSYLRYVTEYSIMGGDVYFIPPIEYDVILPKEPAPPVGDESPPAPVPATVDLKDQIGYSPGQMYAISFISPSEQFCKEGEKMSCVLSIGGLALGAVVVGAGLVAGGIAIAPVAGSAAGATLGAVGTTKVVVGAAATGAVAYGAHELGILHRFTDWALKKILSPFREEVPNFMIVSTLDQAQKMRCYISGEK